MTSLNTTSNATLAQDQVERILIQPLTQRSTYLQQGFPVFASNGEPIKVPSLQTAGTPSYVAEGGTITSVSAVTSEVTLLPGTVHAVKTLLRMTREMTRQSVVNVEALMSAKIASDVTRVLDAALWNGGGTAGAPLGMAQFANVTSAGTAAGTLNSDDLFDMEKAALDAFVDPTQIRWAMSPANYTRIRKLSDNYGARVLQPSLSVGAPATILGHPYTVTTHLPDSTILLFDRSQVAVGMDTRASITLLSELYGETDEIGLRVIARYDTAALNPSAVIRLSGITA